MSFHRIEIKTHSTLRPPASTFLPSTVRGALGYVLKDNVCVFPSMDCTSCTVYSSCVYDKLYDKGERKEDNIQKKGDPPKPIRFDAPYPAKNFDFSLYVFDQSIAIRSLVVAIRRMLMSPTLTGHKYTFPHNEIYLDGQKLDFDERGYLKRFVIEHHTLNLSPIHAPINLVLHLMSPCVMTFTKNDFETDAAYREYKQKKKCDRIKQTITLEEILSSILWRKKYYERNARPDMEDVKLHSLSHIAVSSHLTSEPIQRSKKENPICGVMGTMELRNVDPVTYALLQWGEVLGVGKDTVSGAGKIRIEIQNENIVR